MKALIPTQNLDKLESKLTDGFDDVQTFGTDLTSDFNFLNFLRIVPNVSKLNDNFLERLQSMFNVHSL